LNSFSKPPFKRIELLIIIAEKNKNSIAYALVCAIIKIVLRFNHQVEKRRFIYYDENCITDLPVYAKKVDIRDLYGRYTN